MPGIAREQRELVFESGRGDQCIRKLQTIGKRMRIDERHCPLRDRRCERKNLRLLNIKPALGALQFFLAAAALGELEVGDC